MEMTAYYGVTRSTYYLEHHGVKGQRWGVRRYQNKDGSLTAAGKRHIQNAVSATADMVKRHIPSPEKRAAAAKARQARKEQKAAEKRQKELDSYKTDPRKRLKNMNQLTNEELRALKERIELENRVSDLTREQLEKPKKMADMVLGYAKTGVDIANTITKGYDAIQDFKAMANGTRANGKNLVGEELVKFMDAKDKLAGGKSNTDSDNSSSKNSGGKKDKGPSNSDSDSGSSSDSSTGTYGGKKKGKGGNADKSSEAGKDESQRQNDGNEGTKSGGAKPKDEGPDTVDAEYEPVRTPNSPTTNMISKKMRDRASFYETRSDQMANTHAAETIRKHGFTKEFLDSANEASATAAAKAEREAIRAREESGAESRLIDTNAMRAARAARVSAPETRAAADSGEKAVASSAMQRIMVRPSNLSRQAESARRAAESAPDTSDYARELLARNASKLK